MYKYVVVGRLSETQLQVGKKFMVHGLSRRLSTHIRLIWDQTFEILLFDPYSAGVDFSLQNLTSVDVRF